MKHLCVWTLNEKLNLIKHNDIYISSYYDSYIIYLFLYRQAQLAFWKKKSYRYSSGYRENNRLQF